MPDDRLPKRLYLMLRIHEANGKKKTGSLILKTCYRNLDVNIFGETQENEPDENEQYIQILRRSMVFGFAKFQ